MKALFMRNNEPVQLNSRLNKGLPVKQVFLKGLLESIFEHSVSVKDQSITLPATPCLPWLLSIRVLIKRLASTDENMLNPLLPLELEEINFSEPPFSITRFSIPLKVHEDTYRLQKRWTTKLLLEKDGIHAGVCAELWRVLHAQIDISTESLSDEKELDLLKDFNDDKPQPITFVYFSENYIHIFW